MLNDTITSLIIDLEIESSMSARLIRGHETKGPRKDTGQTSEATR
jgi:hypothetical protein